MAEEGIRRSHAENTAAILVRRAILSLCLALALATCATPSARTPDGIARIGAIVKTAVGDAEETARRARAFKRANQNKRAAIEVQEAEVILRKARNARKRIHETHRHAVADLAALRAQTPADEFVSSGEYDPNFHSDHAWNVSVAANRVDRIGAILVAADRHVATIEQTVATLQDLDIPSRR